MHPPVAQNLRPATGILYSLRKVPIRRAKLPISIYPKEPSPKFFVCMLALIQGIFFLLSDACGNPTQAEAEIREVDNNLPASSVAHRLRQRKRKRHPQKEAATVMGFQNAARINRPTRRSLSGLQE